MTAVDKQPGARAAQAVASPQELGEALGQTRRLIFENVANGVPMPKIMAAFRRSEAEVWQEVEFVGRKIREARFRTRMPPVEHQGLAAIRFNRKVLLETLRQLTDAYLSSGLIIPKIGVQSLDSPAIIREAAQRVKARVVQ
jgi:hypothetical protein